MAGSISFNPYATTNAGGSFNVTSQGYVQGIFMDDPAARYALSGGTYDPAATSPLIGGVPIAEFIRDANNVAGTNPGYASQSGPYIKLATSVGAASAANVTTPYITGFSVLNQAYQGVTTPQSPAPTYGAGGSASFARLGCGLRLAVAMDPGLVSSTGSLITSYFSWDFNTQRLQEYATSATITISSMTYSTALGGSIAVVAAAASDVQAVGDVVNISGSTTTGSGGNSVVNGNFVVVSFTDNEHFSIAATNAGGAAYYGTITPGVLNQGTGILPVKVLDFNIGNSMTYQYDPVNNVYTWNRTGSAALIQL